VGERLFSVGTLTVLCFFDKNLGSETKILTISTSDSQFHISEPLGYNESLLVSIEFKVFFFKIKKVYIYFREVKMVFPF
jgi:hypothetical protein